jgi:hypothetical protein
MATFRSDFEADVRRFSDLLRWTDNAAIIAAGILLISLLIAWWTG